MTRNSKPCAPRAQQQSFLLPSSEPVPGLQNGQAGAVRRIAKLHAEHGQAQRIATIDQEATIIASHKAAALAHSEGGRGYQPMVAVWAAADLVVADQFRAGTVPAKQAPLTCAQMAFAARPAALTARYFRGASAGHENGLLSWLKDPARAQEPGGPIGFAVSAVMSVELQAAVRQVAANAWQTYGQEDDGTRCQWAEVDFVPGEKSAHKDSHPPRYVGLRLLRAQGVLFAAGTDRHYHAVGTKRKLEEGLLLDWQREKAGTVEHVHDEVKNWLGGGPLPSQHFAVTAAWFKLTLLTYNLASAIRGLCFSGAERTGRMQKFRLLLIHLAGRMKRNNCVRGLRLCASREAIARRPKVWAVFELPTHATAAVALGRGKGGGGG